VFAGGRPLTDYIQPPPTSPSSASSAAVSRRFAVRRDRRFTCTVCGKTFTQVSRDEDDDGDGENQGDPKATGSKVDTKFPTFSPSPPLKFRGR